MARNALSVANLVDRAAEKFGDKVLAIREDRVTYKNLGYDHTTKELSFNQALKSCNTVAAALRDGLGVRQGDRIAIVLTNVPEIGLLFTAAARIGAILVPFNYMLKADELQGAIADCGAKVLITEPELFALNIRDKANVPGIEHWVMIGDAKDVPEGFISVDDLTEGFSEARVEPIDLNKNDPIAIFYTSGTTGFPKGAVLTSRNLMSTATLSVRMLRIGKKDMGVTGLPLAHIFGFTTSIIGAFYSGCGGVLLRFFDPVKTLEYVQEYKATVVTGVPAMWNLMLQCHPEKYDLSSIRYWISGADAMPADLIKQLESFGGRFIEGYGLVETSPIISVNSFIKRRGTVGFPVPGVRVKVMDEDGKRRGRTKVGEFVVRGPNVMKGYWNDEERTAEAFKYGWFHTGDMGFRDRLGFLHFVDREKDVVKVGGYSVFSREVEEEILRNPKVFEVALVGAPDPTKGEIPVAFVQLKEGEDATEDEILEWCRDHIARYKAPRMVRIIDDMPLTMTLKVMKRELRSRLLQEAAFTGSAEEPRRKEE
ncbi:MAG: class I adenylate-forming enzyme family protein [Candidatus Geothermincolia bacterium]